MLRKYCHIALGVSFILIPTLDANAEWDPPAVKDFPSHSDFSGPGKDVDEFLEIGQRLFTAKFNVNDGAGRPAATGDSKPTIRFPDNAAVFSRLAGPDAMACSSCHNDPNIGGSGDLVTNVFVGAHLTDPPTLEIDPTITAERNTTGINGAGVIELLAREITSELHALRDQAKFRAHQTGEPVHVELIAKGIQYGKITILPNGSTVLQGDLPIDHDLIIRPFGAKGVASSIREFTLFALNQHHGIQAIERFGWERTGLRDFDLDGVENEFSLGQVSALVAFQASLAPPPQNFSTEPLLRDKELLGRSLFATSGCGRCHVPKMLLDTTVFTEPGPFNRPGAATPDDVDEKIHIELSANAPRALEVRPFTDFRRHNLCDEETRHFCNERIRQDNIDSELFMTAKLWDLASSAPYGHRGDLGTISAAILAHGGAARNERNNFLTLDESDKESLIHYLMTLGNKEE